MITTDPNVAVDVLARGDLCAIPTETVYGLGALASNERAVAKVYEAKGRPANHPLIVHIADFSEVHEWIADLPDWANTLAKHIWPGPLTLVGKRTPRVLDCVTGGQDTVAVRVPQHPLTLQVLTELSSRGIGGVVAPSANRFGHVSPTTAQHVEHDLGAYLSAHDGAILDGGPCTLGVESTIVLATGDDPVILRPGGVTRKMISEMTEREVKDAVNKPRVSGSLASHYSPAAQVQLVSETELAQSDEENSGVIAFAEINTPDAMVRLASPHTIEEFAQCLYAALRQADSLGLTTVYVVTPTDDGLAEAVRDRLTRAAH